MLDELERVGHTARPAEGPAQPYRRHILGLPLQISLFRLSARAATTIGLPGLSSESDFPARLDENGDLFLDRGQVATLAQELRSWFSPQTLEFMHKRQVAACEALVEASENAATRDESTVKVFEDLAHKTALVLAYGVLSKFIPDVLLRALAEAGDAEPPPFPETSAGAELLQNTFALYQACRRLDYSPQRLRHEWPAVTPKVVQLVNEFCQRQTGFGPLAWDSQGYEDARYVVRLLHSAFDEVDVEHLCQRRFAPTNSAVARSPQSVPEKIAALRRVLGFWLEFLERETWYARRAFYVGMIPLLQQLATVHREKIRTFEPADLLFLEVPELVAGIVDPEVIRSRRDRYLENTEYLSLHGVDSSRLATMFRNS